LDIDSIGLVRNRGPAGEAFALEQYVNDRPYVASSFLGVAAQLYRAKASNAWNWRTPRYRLKRELK
jgi:hypothetical protein